MPYLGKIPCIFPFIREIAWRAGFGGVTVRRQSIYLVFNDNFTFHKVSTFPRLSGVDPAIRLSRAGSPGGFGGVISEFAPFAYSAVRFEIGMLIPEVQKAAFGDLSLSR